MRGIIVRIASRPLLDRRSITSLSTWYERQWILEQGLVHECHVHTPKIKEAKDIDWAVDCIELNQYDVVFVQCSTPNFFGGKCSDYTKDLVQMMVRYEGNVVYIVDDPAIEPVNWAATLHERDFLSPFGHGVRAFARQMVQNSRVLYMGHDYVEWSKGKIPIPLLEGYDLSNFFQYVVEQQCELMNIPDLSGGWEYEMSYYGATRNGWRQKKLEMYLGAVKSLVIGHTSKHAYSIKQLPHATLKHELRKIPLSIVLGDECQGADKWRTIRLHELPRWGILSMFDHDYGSPYDAFVNEHCLVTDGEDLIHKSARILCDDMLRYSLLESQREHWWPEK